MIGKNRRRLPLSNCCARKEVKKPILNKIKGLECKSKSIGNYEKTLMLFSTLLMHEALERTDERTRTMGLVKSYSWCPCVLSRSRHTELCAFCFFGFFLSPPTKTNSLTHGNRQSLRLFLLVAHSWSWLIRAGAGRILKQVESPDNDRWKK